MYYIYVLRCDDNSLYTGITTNLSKRLKEHYYKREQGAKYTRARTIVSVELVWETETRSLALKREYAFKMFRKTKKEAIIHDPSLFVDEEYTCVAHEALATYIAD